MHKLRCALDFSNVEEVNHWDADLYATGFTKDNRLIYISTFSYRDAPIVKYYYEVEQIGDSGMSVSKLSSAEDVAFETLVEVIRINFWL